LLITKWAKTHNVAVLISMHAAKGSQNGEQHSAPTDLGEMFWSAYPENVATTVEVVSSLADRYKDEDAFLGFTLLNGPAGTTDESVMLAYYKEAYTAIRATGNDCVLSVMALSYGEGELADFMLAADNYINVWIEWHPYFAFGYDDDSNARLIAAVTDTYQASVTSWNKREGHNALFIGEWSVAVNEGQFADQVDHFYSFAAEQFAVIAQAEAGWTFFSWKTSGEYTGWSMMALLADSKLRALLEQSIKM
jgi:glucan 1,3-beta-glucosidase